MFSGRLVKRKWGWWLVLLNREHFKIKLLRFNRASSLSMQFHNLRNELWLVLKGIGQFNTDLESREISAGHFVQIKPKSWHQLVAGWPMWVLEIQYGEKCVEEDIIRE